MTNENRYKIGKILGCTALGIAVVALVIKKGLCNRDLVDECKQE